MLTIQDKINYLNELVSIAQFSIESIQQAIIDFPDHDKPGGPTRADLLAKQIAKKELYDNEIKRLTNTQ
jgi:hypothetical protein